MGNQERHRLPFFRRLQPSTFEFLKLPKSLSRVTGKEGLFHPYQQAGSLSTHPTVNPGVVPLVWTDRSKTNTQLRLHLGQRVQGLEKLVEQLPFHNVRVEHQSFNYLLYSK